MQAGTDCAIQVRSASKEFLSQEGRPVSVLQDVSFRLAHDSFTSIVGPSGCGKSTLLKLCAGLETPTSGEVLFQGAEVSGVNTGIGYVSQDNTLLPWTDVLTNVTLPLRFRGVPPRERDARGKELLRLMGLEGFDRFYPSQISGGMQKRCIIARAIIAEPAVVLMDEPFGALDAMTKLVLQQDLLEMWERKHTTALFVTHDINEAIALSDRVITMSRRPGRVKGDREIALPRPRNIVEVMGEGAFQLAREQVWNDLAGEIAEKPLTLSNA